MNIYLLAIGGFLLLAGFVKAEDIMKRSSFYQFRHDDVVYIWGIMMAFAFGTILIMLGC